MKEGLGRVLLIGAGDIGRRIIGIIGRRHRVTAATSTPAKRATIKRLGATPALVNLDKSATLSRLPRGIRTIILVTSAFHMRRALTVFEAAGMTVLPAPVPPAGSDGSLEWSDFLPNAQSLMKSHYAIHEMAGWAYSVLRAALTPSSTVGN